MEWLCLLELGMDSSKQGVFLATNDRNHSKEKKGRWTGRRDAACIEVDTVHMALPSGGKGNFRTKNSRDQHFLLV